jgi:hypothetical protein
MLPAVSEPGGTMPRGNNTKSPRTGPRTPGPSQDRSPSGTSERPSTTASADAIEQQVVALAEQLGRVVGTVQAKAEGWMDPKALSDQVARVRDSAASLLQQLGATTEQKTERIVSGRGGGGSLTTIDRGTKVGGRSGGVVDAPGKKHRKPTPNESMRVSATDRARVAKMKAVNANRKRGRG